VKSVVDSRAVGLVSAVEMLRRVVVRAPEMLADARFHSTAVAPSPRLNSVQAQTASRPSSSSSSSSSYTATEADDWPT